MYNLVTLKKSQMKVTTDIFTVVDTHKKPQDQTTHLSTVSILYKSSQRENAQMSGDCASYCFSKLVTFISVLHLKKLC